MYFIFCILKIDQFLGMGHKFLKHVERTKLLLLIADVQGFRLTPKHDLRSCFETVVLLNKVNNITI